MIFFFNIILYVSHWSVSKLCFICIANISVFPRFKLTEMLLGIESGVFGIVRIGKCTKELYLNIVKHWFAVDF